MAHSYSLSPSNGSSKAETSPTGGTSITDTGIVIDVNFFLHIHKIYSIVLKKCASELAPFLTRHFWYYYSSGLVPQAWKTIFLCTLHTDGQRLLLVVSLDAAKAFDRIWHKNYL